MTTPPQDDSTQSGATPQDHTTQDEVTHLQQDLAAMTETAKRALADLQNFKRRAEEERGELQVFANMNMLSAIFPALDNFTRAFATIPEDLKDNDWAKGIMAIEANLLKALTNIGLETIDQIGVPADPQKHEVLMETDSAPEQAGQVVEIFEKGYAFKGKTVRPAKVSVGKA
jgi:molecular chaperone GrpE